MGDSKQPVSVELIANKIDLILGHKVMLSPHLAALYLVETRTLAQAIKRNADRFPADFMFKITSHECDALKSQIVISDSSMRSQFATC